MTALLSRKDHGPTAHRWHSYDIHGLAVRVDASAPTAAILREMLAPFTVGMVGDPNIEVTGPIDPPSGASNAEHAYRFTTSTVHLCSQNVQVTRESRDRWRLSGPGELLTSLLPLVDRLLVERDVAMIHAATVDLDGDGIALPAWGGTGKTSTVAKLLRMPGAAFMGDDWAFASAGGRLLGYAKPMFVKPHHREIFPHLFDGVHKPLVPSRLLKPTEELATFVHPVITRYPRLAAFCRRWSPEHRMVDPSDALPGAPISRDVPLRMAVFIERFDGPASTANSVTPQWMTSRMIGNFHSELPRSSHELMDALAAAGLMPLEDVFADKARVLRSALADVPCFTLRVPSALGADRASDEIVEHLVRLREQTLASPLTGTM